MNRLSKSKFRELRKELFALFKIVSNNAAKIELHRAKVDENRTLIIANSIANGTAVRKLAQEPYEEALVEILQAILEANEELDPDVKVDAGELVAHSLFFEHAKQKIQINRRVLELSKELVEVNSKLIEINKLSMELTADIAMAKSPADSYEEAMSIINKSDFDQDYIDGQIDIMKQEINKNLKEARVNTDTVEKLNTQSEMNRLMIAKNAKDTHLASDHVEVLSCAPE